MNNDIKEKQKNLEKMLWAEAKTPFKERLNTIKKCKWALIPAAITVVGIYLLIDQTSTDELIKSYQKASSMINGLESSLDQLAQMNAEITTTPEMIEMPEILIEQGSELIRTEKAKEVLQSIEENKYLFEKGSEIGPARGYLTQLSEKMADLTYRSKWKLIAGPISLFGGFTATLFYIKDKFENPDKNLTEEEKNKYEDRKSLKKALRWNVDKDFRKKMYKNQHADKIYQIANNLKKEGVWAEEILDVVVGLAGYRKKIYGPIYDKVLDDPKKYNNDTAISNLFWNYEYELKQKV